MKKLLLFTLSFMVVACAHQSFSKKDLATISNSDLRSEKNILRNNFRHPVETLAFFEVRPEHTVVEIGPGGGWYTEILGPYLKDSGKLYLAIFSDTSERSYAPKLNAKIKEMVSDKEHYGDVAFTVMEAPNNIGPVAPDGSVDRVLTFRNVHNWMKDKKAKEVFKSFYKALKPGGILGVVEHRASNDEGQDPKAISGYVREDYVVMLALEAGFKLVDKSEINANPKDKANHPKGVWTLPPSLRLGDTDKDKYMKIGESDRMTLKFVK
jgi:predicted methyltransferase